jgi:hypothetical protein
MQKKSKALIVALERRKEYDSILVQEHVQWALDQHSSQ